MLGLQSALVAIFVAFGGLLSLEGLTISISQQHLTTRRSRCRDDVTMVLRLHALSDQRRAKKPSTRAVCQLDEILLTTT